MPLSELAAGLRLHRCPQEKKSRHQHTAGHVLLRLDVFFIIPRIHAKSPFRDDEPGFFCGCFVFISHSITIPSMMVFCCLLSEYRALGELLTTGFRWGSKKVPTFESLRQFTASLQTLGSTPRPDVKVQLWNHAWQCLV